MKLYQMDCGCKFPIVEGFEYKEGELPLIEFDVRNCNYNCPKVWHMLGKGQTKGIFQLESSLGKQLSKRLKPTCMEHLTAMGTLMRPGCMQVKGEDGVNTTERYSRIKNKEEQPKSIHPAVDKILGKTFNLILYQECLMSLGRELAGFDLVGMDELRKAVGAKDQAKLAKVGEKFIDGVVKCGIISKELGESLWKDIKASGRYLFCAAHSREYAVNGYWSAYYKAHFPLLFYTGYLRGSANEAKPFDEICELINDAKLMDIEVKTPSILNTKKHFDTDGKVIYFGLVDIKGVGQSHFEKIRESFQQGKPATWYEFLLKHSLKIGLSTCDKLVKCGALDCISKLSRSKMIDELDKFDHLSKTELKWVEEHGGEYDSFESMMVSLAKPKKEGGGCHNKNRLNICLDIVKLLKEPVRSMVDDPTWIAWNEKILLGECITCSKVDGCDISAVNCSCKEFRSGRGASGKYKDLLNLGVTINTCYQAKIKSGDNEGKVYCRMSVADNTCSIDDVVIWPEKFEEFQDLLFEGNVVCLSGYRSPKDSFVVEAVWQL